MVAEDGSLYKKQDMHPTPGLKPLFTSVPSLFQ